MNYSIISFTIYTRFLFCRVGLLPGDIIFEAEDKPVKSLSHLHDMLKRMKKLTLKVLRDGEIYNTIIIRERI